MKNKLTFSEVYNLLKDVNKWKLSESSIFGDEIETKDGLYCMYADQGICLRDLSSRSIVWQGNPLTWLVTKWLSNRLLKRLESLEDIKKGDQ